jgi:hypothetical protein
MEYEIIQIKINLLAIVPGQLVVAMYSQDFEILRSKLELKQIKNIIIKTFAFSTTHEKWF